MIIKIIVLGLAGMLAYRWLSPPRALQQDQSPPPPDKEEFTDYEVVDDDN